MDSGLELYAFFYSYVDLDWSMCLCVRVSEWYYGIFGSSRELAISIEGYTVKRMLTDLGHSFEVLQNGDNK